MTTKLTPKRPYILQAYYNWLIDNDLTPYLLVDTTYPQVQVPSEYISDNRIVLNISPSAVGHFEFAKDALRFSCRFGGIIRDLYVPIGSAMAIYARENAEGIQFEPELAYQQEMLAIKSESVAENKAKISQQKPAKATSASHLKIIK